MYTIPAQSIPYGDAGQPRSTTMSSPYGSRSYALHVDSGGPVACGVSEDIAGDGAEAFDAGSELRANPSLRCMAASPLAAFASTLYPAVVFDHSATLFSCRRLSSALRAATFRSSSPFSLSILFSSHRVVLNGSKKPIVSSHQQRSTMGMAAGIISVGRSGIRASKASPNVVMLSDQGRLRGVSSDTGGQ